MARVLIDRPSPTESMEICIAISVPFRFRFLGGQVGLEREDVGVHEMVVRACITGLDDRILESCRVRTSVTRRGHATPNMAKWREHLYITIHTGTTAQL